MAQTLHAMISGLGNMRLSVFNMKELRSIHSKGLEVPCQNTFKDKPAFFKRLIKVLVARNLFLVHSSSCKNNRPIWKRFYLWIYYNAWSNL